MTLTLIIGHVLALLAKLSLTPSLAGLIVAILADMVRGWDEFAEWALAETKAAKEPPRCPTLRPTQNQNS